MSIIRKKIFSFSPSVFGLDLDDLSVKVVQIDQAGEIDHVRSCGFSPIPAGAIVDGRISNVDAVASAILHAMQNAKPNPIKTKHAVCSLPENKSFIRIVEMPNMKEEEMGQALKWQIEENIPLTIDQVYYDWALLPESFNIQQKNTRSILLVAVSKHVVEAFISAVEHAGVEVSGTEVESLAIAHSLIENSSQKTTLVLDIADRRTNLLFSVGGIISFTSELPVSAHMFTESIAKSLNMSLADAESLKIQRGVGSMVQHDPLFSAVESVLENLVSQIQTTIDFFLNSLMYSKNLDDILLCGGGGQLKGLTVYLSKRLGRRVQLGNPWVNTHLGKNLPPISKEESIRYSTAIGLALRAQNRTYENLA